MLNTPLQSNDAGFNLKEYMMAIIEKWYITAVICPLCILIAFIGTKFFSKPMYTSTAKIYILNTQSGTINSGEISVSTFLAMDYQELLVDSLVLDEVISELGLNTSADSLRSAISITNPENTRFIVIAVKTTDAAMSKKIADSICNVAQEKIVSLMGIDRVNIIRYGNLPTSPSSPVMHINLLKGLLIGLVISLASVFVIYILNDKIKGSADVEKHLGISVLGVIPYSKSRASAKS